MFLFILNNHYNNDFFLSKWSKRWCVCMENLMIVRYKRCSVCTRNLVRYKITLMKTKWYQESRVVNTKLSIKEIASKICLKEKLFKISIFMIHSFIEKHLEWGGCGGVWLGVMGCCGCGVIAISAGLQLRTPVML